MVMIRRVVGESMTPYFMPGTLVLGLRFRRPKKGDVVIATKAGRDIIKRIATTRDNTYFLVGDNKSASTDSRTYGWVPAKAIKSVVIASIKR